ncbi:hypothetical protein O1611_g7104 [Lasiodiplodia mahajangana]|uniref:Uncharacterized protein n=1 Tax=Lasiodiplodia mahajangana TaxID=1108764 RepID=A0ACC2JGM9_9PEZI|nr:hypothetical protein O1611_g7104 [Lasiodiplodia mahajangana]
MQRHKQSQTIVNGSSRALALSDPSGKVAQLDRSRKRERSNEPEWLTESKRAKHDDEADDDSEEKPAPKPIPPNEKPAVIEERTGEIEFRVVNNDNTRESLLVLARLIRVYRYQLPEMGGAYISRLVYDRTHLSIVIVGKSLRVIGGITFRPFDRRQFAEIVFCAVHSNQQVKGYGAHLMSHLKDYVKATSDVRHFLTYADNLAVNFFKKQGFTKDITLPDSVWMGCIKDYNGGTIMQCSMLPRIRYLEARRMLLKQKKCVEAKIRALTNSHPHQSPYYNRLARLLSDMQTHQAAWPFWDPVNGDDNPDYYKIITEPMDLSIMWTKLEADQYPTPREFLRDAHRLFKNCRKYNAEGTIYVKEANRLENYMWRRIRAIPEWSQVAPQPG